MMRTGNPIAAMVCEIATVHATPKACMPMKSHIFLRATLLSGFERWMNRRSELRYQNFWRMPLFSIEPHFKYFSMSVCVESVDTWGITYTDHKKHTCKHRSGHDVQYR